MRNQNRIEGTYGIVSVWQADQDWNTNDLVHRAQVDMLIREGYRVQELAQASGGRTRRAIRIEGVNHVAKTMLVANAHEQSRYMLVGGGEATLYSADALPCTFAQQVETTDTNDYFQVQGFRFRFI